MFFFSSAFDDKLEWVAGREASEQKWSSAREMTLGTSRKVSLQEEIGGLEWNMLPGDVASDCISRF